MKSDVVSFVGAVMMLTALLVIYVVFAIHTHSTFTAFWDGAGMMYSILGIIFVTNGFIKRLEDKD